MKKTVGIVDYGLGNLRSVAGAVERLGHNPVITSCVNKLTGADKLILPGVGAFGDGMDNLHDRGLVDPLNEIVLEQGAPIMGICLGAQLMALQGQEFGSRRGLGWIDGVVVGLEPEDTELRVPHVGWNDLIQIKGSILFTEIPEDALFYYVHSFHVQCADEELVYGECEYGQRFTAVFQKGNIFGTQFHPEKSQLHGLTVLRNFLERVN